MTADDGAVARARRLFVTTEVFDELPELPGLRALWGTDVIVCPYCHGFEIADQPLGVLDTGPWAVHQALIFRQWTDDVVLFLHHAAEPSRDEHTKLAARGIEVVLDPVVGLEATDGHLSGIQLASGRVVARRALALMPRAAARAGPTRRPRDRDRRTSTGPGTTHPGRPDRGHLGPRRTGGRQPH